MASVAAGAEEVLLGQEGLVNAYDGDSVESPTPKGWDGSKYLKDLSVEVVSESAEGGYELCFDVINVDAPFANSVRRALISHVPTMAIEKLYLYQNTSLVQDEVLAHRLGLIPIKADPRRFDFPAKEEKKKGPPQEPPSPDPKQTLVFELKVKCRKRQGLRQNTTEPKELYEHAVVYSGDMVWCPIGNQAEEFPDPPRPYAPDIIIAKLRPGQEMEARLHCVKGVGADHAKFSPVATAAYRLLPTVRILDDPATGRPYRITGKEIGQLKESFSTGVIGTREEGGEEVAFVADARADMCSRNVFRYPDLANKVSMGRRTRHFIFSVESTEALASADLVVEAAKALQAKCSDLLGQLDAAGIQ